MTKYSVWLEPAAAGIRFQETIEIPDDAPQSEIEEMCKDVAFNWFDWGYDEVEETEK